MTVFRSDDRVLLLAIPPAQELAEAARAVDRGVVAVLGRGSDLAEARSLLSEFRNVTFLDGLPDQVPWRDAFFTKIVVPRHLERIFPHAAAELHRLLAPGGEIIHEGVYV